MKSLEEAAKIADLSRRKIQEYEKAGTVKKPDMKTEHGYLRYDDQDIFQLLRVRFYRGLGYNRSKIRNLLNDSAENQQKAITDQIEKLKGRRRELDSLITIAEAVRDRKISLDAMFLQLPRIEDLPYSYRISLFSTGVEIAQHDKDDLNIPDLSDCETEHCEEILQSVFDLKDSGEDLHGEEIQRQIGRLYQIACSSIGPSVLIFYLFSLMAAPQSEMGTILDHEYGTGSASAFIDAAQFYCSKQIDNSLDQLFTESVHRLSQYSLGGFSAADDEVQLEIRRLELFFRKARIFQNPLQALKNLEIFLESEAFSRCADWCNAADSATFISDAIKCYCADHIHTETEE